MEVSTLICVARLLSNHDALPARHPFHGLKIRNRQWCQKWLAVFPETPEWAFLPGRIERVQKREVTRGIVCHPLVKVAHAGVVEQLKAVAAGFLFVALEFVELFCGWALLHFVSDLAVVLR